MNKLQLDGEMMLEYFSLAPKYENISKSPRKVTNFSLPADFAFRIIVIADHEYC